LNGFIKLIKSKIKTKHIITLVLLLVPLWFIGINGFLFSSSSYHIIYDETAKEIVRLWVGDFDGLLMTLIISVIIVSLWMIGIYTCHTDRFIDCFSNWKQLILRNPKKTLLHTIALFSIALCAVISEIILGKGASLLSLTSAIKMLFYITIGTSLYCIVVFRNSPEKLFLSLSLLIGCLYITAHPPMWYGWDNRAHYAWALEESFIWTVSVSEMDLMFSTVPEMHVFWNFDSVATEPNYRDWLSGYTYTTLYTFRKGTDTISELGFDGYNFYTRLAYIPTGLMLFVGRSLALPPIIIVKLGTLGNHLLYSLIVFLAIKRLNSGKHIMAVLAMFPTAFVLSTTYGYDYWVTSFTMLGFAYFFNEVQSQEKIKLKNIIMMIGSFVIGLGPKAIYVPLILVLLFMRKDKFETERGCKGYRIAVVSAFTLVFASFVIPFIISGNGGNDMRGGADVDSAAQFEYILHNPIAYGRVLWDFLLFYLNIPNNIHNTLNFATNFAHLPQSPYYHLIWILLLFVTLTDRNEKDTLTSTAGYKVVVSLFVLSTVALFSTALYIAFTAVGASHIAGVQGRYLFPVIFPFLYVVGGFKIRNEMNKTVYSCCVFGIMSFILLSGAWNVIDILS
jgi:uncharacterized membrane protein